MRCTCGAHVTHILASKRPRLQSYLAISINLNLKLQHHIPLNTLKNSQDVRPRPPRHSAKAQIREILPRSLRPPLQSQNHPPKTARPNTSTPNLLQHPLSRPRSIRARRSYLHPPQRCRSIQSLGTSTNAFLRITCGAPASIGGEE